MRYGCRMREGDSQKARSREEAEREERVRMWRVERRVCWFRVKAAGLALGRVRREGRDWVERVYETPWEGGC